MTLLSELSPELLEEIVVYLTAPSHLLSLALTSKALHSAIVPNHIEFRHIRTSLRNNSFWNFLTERPLLASYIHGLEIIAVNDNTQLETEGLLLPRSFPGLNQPCSPDDSATSKAALTSMFLALPLMRSLEDFTYEDSSLGERSIIEEFRNENGSECQVTLPIALLIRRIQKARQCTLAIAAPKALDPGGLVDSIANSPGMLLTHLCIITRGHGTLSHLFEVAHWPVLRKVTLMTRAWLFRNVSGDKEQRRERLTDFLSRHPLLEVFRLVDQEYFGIVTIPENSMLALRTIDFSGLSFHNTHWLPTDVGERLWFTPYVFNRFSLHHLASLKQLRFCLLSDAGPEDLVRLAEIAPQLERLRYEPGDRGYNYHHKDTFQHVIKALQNFKKLTHLAEYCALIPSTPRVWKSICDIPNLTYVEMKDGWVELERKKNGAYATHYAISRAKVEADSWGNFYHGNRDYDNCPCAKNKD